MPANGFFYAAMLLRRLALFAGPLFFLLFGAFGPSLGSPAATWTAAIAVWMALWWIVEPVDAAVTALLPLVLFPACGVLPARAVSAEYGNEIIFLFLAGFLFGKTIERWGLHRRIALRLVLALGTGPRGILLGFMVATAFVSMWISNTATAVMMTPVAIAVASWQSAVTSAPTTQSEGSSVGSPTSAADEVATGRRHLNFNKALLLGVGYACSIGGLATVVGTPTNGIFLTFVQQKMGTTVSFTQWLAFGLPFAAALLLVCWVLLLRMFPLDEPRAAVAVAAGRGVPVVNPLRAEYRSLGPLSVPEARLLLVFGTVVLAWITGSLVWYRHAGNGVGDTVVAVAGAIALFLVPAGRAGERTALLDWPTAVRIPWGIILFFGGGLALAKGFDQSGLATWMGAQMKNLQTLPQVVILFSVLAIVVLLSELASNIATASMMMPVLAALAGSIGAEPFGLLLSATLAASFGFGLPIATAPNTIVFSSGYLTTRDMARAGFLLDLLAVLLLLAFIYGVFPLVW
jgi:sodium-dependent dicarboxylate transporter 2/3/5